MMPGSASRQSPPLPSLRDCAFSGRAALGAVLLMGTLYTGSAHAEAVCSNTPATDEWVKCEKAQGTTGEDIDINLNGVAIETPAEVYGPPRPEIFHGLPVQDLHGVWASHQGAGNIRINVQGTTDKQTITAVNPRSGGIYGLGAGKGNINIDVRDVTIMTSGEQIESAGVHGNQAFNDSSLAPYDGTYHVDIDVRGSSITTMGADTPGIRSILQGPTDLDITGYTKVNVEHTSMNADSEVDFFFRSVSDFETFDRSQ